MSKKQYSSLLEIKQDLKIHKLKRDITFELLNGNKTDFEKHLAPMKIFQKFLSPAKKILVSLLVKKVFK